MISTWRTQSYKIFIVCLFLILNTHPAKGDTWNTISAWGVPNEFQYGNGDLIMGWDNTYAPYGVTSFNFVNKIETWRTWPWLFLDTNIALNSTCRLMYDRLSEGYKMFFRVECSGDYCDLSIPSWTVSSNTFIPQAGDAVAFTGIVKEGTGRPLLWTITVGGNGYNKAQQGTGAAPQLTWNGKDDQSRFVSSGQYNATLIAKTSDGKCVQTSTTIVTVVPPSLINSCPLNVKTN